MSIDSLPAEMLQGGHYARKGSQQLQRDLLAPCVDVVRVPRVSDGQRASRQRHVVMDELQHAVEARHGLHALGVRLKEKGLVVALHPQVLGARLGLDAEREEVPVVRAVSYQKGPAGLRVQQVIGLFAADGAPVEAALLEHPDGVLHHLELQLRAEGLVTVRRQPHACVKQAAAHCVVKLAVGDHGATHKPPAAGNTTQSVVLTVKE